MKPSPASLVDIGWWLMGAVIAMALFVHWTAGSSLGLRRFVTPEPSDRYTVAQRFTMDAPGLSAIEIRTRAVRAVSGRYDLILRDRTSSNERLKTVDAADLVRDRRYLFAFDPIEDAHGHEFEFEIRPAASNIGRGVALWATMGSRRDGGGLVINGKPRWASLAFRTRATAGSLLAALTGDDDPDRPPRWLAIAGLLGSWIGVRFVARALLSAGDGFETRRRTPIAV
jgi:hypothetical protein